MSPLSRCNTVWNYVMVVGAAVCVAGQFVFMKTYQSKVGSTTAKTFAFSAIAAALSCFLFLCVNVFSVRVSAFSVLMALGMSFACTLNSVLGIVAVSYGKLSVFTMSMMLGGMLLPFLYGLLFLEEPVTPWRIAGCVLLVAALVYTSLAGNTEGKKNRLLFYGLCALVFLSNGAVSIISKCHQIGAQASGTIDYCIVTYAFMLAFSALSLAACLLWRRLRAKRAALPLAAQGESAQAENGAPATESSAPMAESGVPVQAAADTAEKAEAQAGAAKGGARRGLVLGWLSVAAYAVISGAGYLLQLFGAVDLPASVLYPIVTGGSIVLTAVLGRVLFKERVTWKMWIGFGVALLATVLFLF